MHLSQAFCTRQEAVAYLKRGDRSVFVVSASWLTSEHADPAGATLETLINHLRRHLSNSSGRPEDAALFWDWPCVPQRGWRFSEGVRTLVELSAKEKHLSLKAADSLGLLYTSLPPGRGLPWPLCFLASWSTS